MAALTLAAGLSFPRTHMRGMVTLLTILTALAMIGTLGTLLAGMLGMTGSADDSGRRSNGLMRLRVMFQGAALVLFALLLLAMRARS